MRAPKSGQRDARGELGRHRVRQAAYVDRGPHDHVHENNSEFGKPFGNRKEIFFIFGLTNLSLSLSLLIFNASK